MNLNNMRRKLLSDNSSLGSHFRKQSCDLGERQNDHLVNLGDMLSRGTEARLPRFFFSLDRFFPQLLPNFSAPRAAAYPLSGIWLPSGSQRVLPSLLYHPLVLV